MNSSPNTKKKKKEQEEEEEKEEAERTRSSTRYVAREKGLLAAVANLGKAGISTFSHQKVSARADLQARASLR